MLALPRRSTSAFLVVGFLLLLFYGRTRSTKPVRRQNGSWDWERNILMSTTRALSIFLSIGLTCCFHFSVRIPESLIWTRHVLNKAYWRLLRHIIIFLSNLWVAIHQVVYSPVWTKFTFGPASVLYVVVIEEGLFAKVWADFHVINTSFLSH